MKHRAWIVATAACMALATAVPAQTPVTDASVLVANERAFAATALSKGIRVAFMEWMAPTGVIFAPGPVIGRRSYEARPATPAILAWTPERAVMSASGEMGWTTGPWTIRQDSTQTEPSAYGQFVTVWRKQADGTWRASIDAGISHGPAPSTVAEPLLRTLPAMPVGWRKPLAERKSLWQVDAEFVKLARASGPAAALRTHASGNVVVLRDGAERWVGAVASDSIAAREPSVNMMSTAQFMSQAGDLGYTYGTYVVPREADADSGHYVHIWERDPSRVWKLALEVVLPLPKKR